MLQEEIKKISILTNKTFVMNGISKLLIKVFFLNILSICVVNAQTLKQDSTLNTPIEKADSFFNKAIKQQSRLFNGPAFQNYGSNVDGSANFQDIKSFTNGSVIYDGILFDNIPLMYDLYEDKVISLLSRSTMFSLVSQKLSDFYLNNHHFKYINVIDTATSIIKPGFFDIIYDGKLKVLAKREKKLQYAINNQDMRYYFVPKTTYYLARNDKYEAFSSESSFLNLFKDKKNELKKHLRNNGINFKKKPEEAMILLATYYENYALN